MGAGQFGIKGREWFQRFFHYPERMAELFDYFCEQGFPGVHVVGYPTIVKAARLTKEKYPLKIAVSLLPDNWNKNLTEITELEPEVVFIHGAMTDNFLQRNIAALKTCFQAIRDQGGFPGLATHDTKRTLSKLLNNSNPLQEENFGLLLPINSKGWGMGGTTSEIMNLIQKTDKYSIMAMKTLAAGQLQPEEALKFVFSIQEIRVATIGMINKKEVAEIAAIGNSILNKEK